MPIVILLLIGLVVLVFVLPIRAAIRSGEALLQIERLREQFAKLHHRLEVIQERLLNLERGNPVTVAQSAPEPVVGKETEPDSEEFLAAHRRLMEITEGPRPQEPAGTGRRSANGRP